MIVRSEVEAPPAVAPSPVASLDGFRPDVQVLRGVAVLAVVMFHAGGFLPGGYVGVDVFFVISGFVIGRLLLTGLLTSGGVGFARFYTRRARRLLPALGLMLTVVLLLAPWLAPIGAGDSASITRGTGIAAALFSANGYLYKATQLGYFGAPAELNPLLHTWSLSVEEQFYFAVPALLLVAWRLGARRGRSAGGIGGLRSIRVVVVAALVLSFAACLLFTYRDEVGPLSGIEFAFFSPVTRAWEFVAGLALVVLPVRWLVGRRARQATLVVGVLLLAASFVLHSDTTTFPGAAALVPVLGTALVVYAGTARPAEGPTDSVSAPWWRPWLWLGAISYSWYLWHWPFIVFVGAFWPNAGSVPLVVAATISLVPAWLSYRCLEQRLRVSTDASGALVRQTVVLAVVCIVAPLLAAAVFVPVDDALASRTDFTADLEPHADAVSRCNQRTPLSEPPPSDCTWLVGDDASATPAGGTGQAPSVLLIGDSNAGQFSEALIGGAAQAGADLQIATSSGCPLVDAVVDATFPAPGVCRRFVADALDDLTDDPPDLVVIANSTTRYVNESDVALVDPDTGERLTGEADKARLFEAGLGRAVSRLSTAGIRVAVISEVPKPGLDWDPRQCSNLLLLTDRTRCLPPDFVPSDGSSLVTANALERRAAEASGGLVWDFSDDVCPADRCTGEQDGAMVWRDGDHLSVPMSEALASAVTQELDRSLGG